MRVRQIIVSLFLKSKSVNEEKIERPRLKKKETYYFQRLFFFHYFYIWFYLQMQPAQGNLCSKLLVKNENGNIF